MCRAWFNSLQQTEQLLPVAVLFQRVSESRQLLGIYPLLVEGDFFGAGDHEALALLQGGNDASGFVQAFVS
jgi:hypothetical protein